MNDQTEIKQYRWPDLSPVMRRFVICDDQGRYGVAYSDPIYHEGMLFAHPVDVTGTISPLKVPGAEALPTDAILMTNTAWRIQPDGVYAGTWYDYVGPTHVPPELIRRITIIDDLGYIMPDQWADHLLPDMDANQPPKTEVTIAQAEDYAREVGEPVTSRGIRLAAAHGHIPGARKIGRDWLIPYDGFNHYLDHRPKPGRKGKS